jgi:hypothetical protein
LRVATITLLNLPASLFRWNQGWKSRIPAGSRRRLLGRPLLQSTSVEAYQLELPPQLSDVHDVFRVSQLKKCLRVPEEQISVEDLDAKEDLCYQEHPVRILETSERVTRNKKIKMCKVQWSHHTEDEATREREEELKAEFPSFFSDPSESRGQDSF